MNRILKGMLITAGLTVGAASLAAAPADGWIEQHLREKTGISTPVESNTAYRAEPTTNVVAPSWIEQQVKAKQGRYSPQEEARQRDLQNNVAFRQEAAQPAPNRIDRHVAIKREK